MCFSTPKPPEVTDPGTDPELSKQRIALELDTAAQKKIDKERRAEDEIAKLRGLLGRSSLFSGFKGGQGFGGGMIMPLGANPGTWGGGTGYYTPGGRYSFYDLPTPAPAPAPTPAPTPTPTP